MIININHSVWQCMTGAVITGGENQGYICNKVHRIQHCLGSFVWMGAQWMEKKEPNFIYINFQKWLKFWKLSSLDPPRDACQGEQILNKRQWKRGRRLADFASAWLTLGSALLGCIRHPMLQGLQFPAYAHRTILLTRHGGRKNLKYISIIISIIVNCTPTGFQFSNHK